MPASLPKNKDPDSIEKYRFIHNFLPQPHTRKRARLLSNKAITIYCIFIILVLTAFKTVPRFLPGVLGYASNIKVSDLLEYTNEKRKEAGLHPLKFNDTLSKAAQKKAEDMFRKGYWSHTSPDGTEPWDFILSEDYDYSFAGENLAKNFNTSEEVVNAWYNSPSHKENLLNKNYTEIGFAVVNGVLDGYETTLVVQMFGKPRQPSYLATAETQEPRIPEPDVAPVAQDARVPVVQTSELRVPARTFTYPLIDISALSRIVGVTFGGYLATLLAIDYWYSKSRSIPKFTGHTFAHLTFLLLAICGMWLALAPGKIL